MCDVHRFVCSALVASGLLGCTGIESGLPDGQATGLLPSPDGGVMEATFEVDGDDVIYQGDILFSRSEVEALNQDGIVNTRMVQSTAQRKWPNGVVPYEFAPDFKAKKAALKAMSHWEKKTPIRFVQRTNEKHGLRFINSKKENLSLAYFGFNGTVREVKIWHEHGPDTVMHELGHAVASMMHTHTRFDRDDHIKINWDNIEKEHRHNFDVHSHKKNAYRVYISSTRPEYDLVSIMNYYPYAFAIDRKIKTITYLDKEPKNVGNETELSEGDIAFISDMYNGRLLPVDGNLPPGEVADHCGVVMEEVRADASGSCASVIDFAKDATVVREEPLVRCEQTYKTCIRATARPSCKSPACR